MVGRWVKEGQLNIWAANYLLADKLLATKSHYVYGGLKLFQLPEIVITNMLATEEPVCVCVVVGVGVGVGGWVCVGVGVCGFMDGIHTLLLLGQKEAQYNVVFI